MKFAKNIFLFLVLCVSFSNCINWSYAYLRYFKQKAIDIIDHAGPKDECSKHLKALITDVFNLKKLWAIQMIDASAKLQTGFLRGNIFLIGNYDQCLNIYEDKGDDGIIEGQYCTVAVTPSKNVSNSDLGQILDFTNSVTEVMGIQEGREIEHILKLIKMIYGICLPKSCGVETIQKLWNHVEYSFRLPLHVTFGDNFCSHKGKVPHVFEFDGVILWALGLFIAFICFASIYDTMFVGDGQGETLWEDVLLSFSVRKNSKKILDVSSDENEDTTFSCISGLKAISMLWVIFGHKYTLGYCSATVNMLDYFSWRRTIPALFVIVAPFAVDTFLVISGLLLAYKYMQIKDMLPPNKPFPYFMFYFMRLLRLWPCLIATILVQTSVLKYLNDGPLWPLFAYKMALSCRYTGLATALFATNFVSFHFQCLEPTWYLAVDTQLYCIAPLLLYFLHKYPKRTTLSFLILSVISALHTYNVTVSTRQKWTPSEGDDSYQFRIYQSTFVRMPSWIFGILTGAFLYNFQHIRIPKVVTAFMWSLISICLIGVFAANNILIALPYNEYNAGIYNAVARSAWAIAISLLIALGATGNGGVVNNILSLNIYKPLIKISYSVYLVHSSVILLIMGGKRGATFHDTFVSFHGFLGDLPFILIFSFFWCLAFESPFINITKLIIKQGKKDLDTTVAIAPDDPKRLRKTMPESKDSSKRRRSKSKKVK